MHQEGKISKVDWIRTTKDKLTAFEQAPHTFTGCPGLQTILCVYRAAVAEIELSENWGGTDGAGADTPTLQMANIDSLVSTCFWIIKLGQVDSSEKYLKLINSVNALMSKKVSRKAIMSTLRLATDMNMVHLSKKISPNTNIHLPPHVLNYTRLQDMVGTICAVSALNLPSVNKPLYSPRHILHAARELDTTVKFLTQFYSLETLVQQTRPANEDDEEIKQSLHMFRQYLIQKRNLY